METEIADYLNAASEEEKQHFIGNYGEQTVIVQALYIRFIKGIRYRKSRGLHESDNICTTFLNTAAKIAKRVHMTADDFINQRFLPYIAEKRKKSTRQFYKLYTEKIIKKIFGFY